MSTRKPERGADRNRRPGTQGSWRRLGLWLLVGALAGAGPAAARTWHVPQEQPSIAAGLAAAAAGDTVLVACGVYAEHGLAMVEGVVLRGETGLADDVTVDAAGQGRILSCEDLSPATVIEGFTFANGSDAAAGGVFCNHASPVLRDCAVVGCTAGLDGAGFYCNESAPVLERCLFADNATSGGAGGGFCSRLADPVLRGCVFTGNRAGGWGGGFYASGADNVPRLDKCAFAGNQAEHGGAVACKGTLTQIVECELRGNAASVEGGGLYLDFAAAVFAADVVFEGNAAPDGKAGLVTASSTLLMQCCALDPTTMGGAGQILYDDTGCGTPAVRSAWGEVKRLYR
jgi:predicted outer membrane repeat protein